MIPEQTPKKRKPRKTPIKKTIIEVPAEVTQVPAEPHKPVYTPKRRWRIVPGSNPPRYEKI
jgi:hypothetical protein